MTHPRAARSRQPRTPGARREWRRWIDTSLDSPEDIRDVESAPVVSSASYRVEARSAVVLVSDLEPAMV